jgi:hypothetical protein
MKRTFVMAAGMIFFISACNAQYRINKTKYDYHTYSYQMGDPYIPSAMSLASVFIPGLGHIIEGESLRGLCFIGGSLSLAVIKRAVVWNRNYSLTFQDVIRQSNRIGQIALRVWSAFDASRVAKVNNLAFRARYNSNINFTVLPYSDITDPYGLINSDPIGMTIIVSF